MVRHGNMLWSVAGSRLGLLLSDERAMRADATRLGLSGGLDGGEQEADEGAAQEARAQTWLCWANSTLRMPATQRDSGRSELRSQNSCQTADVELGTASPENCRKYCKATHHSTQCVGLVLLEPEHAL